MAKGDWRAAEEAFLQAVRLEPHTASLYARLGSARLQLGKLQDAEKSFAEAVRLQPRQPSFRMGLAEVYLRRSKLDEAAKQFTTLVSLDPKSFDAHYNLGLVLLMQKSCQQAIAQLERADELSPSKPAVLVNIVDAYLCAGDTAGAKRKAESVRRQWPDSPKVLYSLGLVLSRNGSYELASEVFARAGELLPSETEIGLQWVRCKLALGSFQDALSVLLKIRARIPPTEETELLLGHSYVGLGDGDSAIQAFRAMSEERLHRRVPHSNAASHEELLEDALEDHLFRTLAELFGKEEGYCKGRGGGMHIADFSVGHLGANAIVGGSVPIATGAALGCRYLRNGAVVCCFAGDGAYANGVVLESLNFAAQCQFTNEIAGPRGFGIPIIFFVLNNHYAMTGRSDTEILGIRHLVRRAAGFADNNMHAEIVNGMDVLAVRDATLRAAALCRQGQGPVFLDVDTYRYYGHSLSDPRDEYRTREEEAAWKGVDPIFTFRKQLLECGVLNEEASARLEAKVRERNARAAIRAAKAADPDPVDVIKYMYTDTTAETVPPESRKVEIIEPAPVMKRVQGQITYRDAIKEALIEEMKRDGRVIFYGEDVAEYGGAFKLSKGLLETFGRDRVFNAPISEAAICGTAVGAAMLGLRPVVELMYMDFALMAEDQICNQAAKWHYMSGAQVEVPLVIRASVGGGKGYGGQHSQTLESLMAHVPGLYVVYPATPYDAKGMMKSAIRDNNPAVFVESQLLYGEKGVVPEEEYLVPLGIAEVKRSGNDLTVVAWGPAVQDSLKAADRLQTESGASIEVVDLRSLVPLDIETVLRSVQKTGRCVVVSQAVQVGSYTGEVASRVQSEAFDYLDAPILRVGAKNGIAPQSHVLEAAFLPTVEDILAAARSLL